MQQKKAHKPMVTCLMSSLRINLAQEDSHPQRWERRERMKGG